MPSFGRTSPNRLHYKDPKDNKCDLSIAEDAEEALAVSGEEGSAIGKLKGDEYAALDLDSKIVMLMYLDKDDKVVHMTQGLIIPTSYKNMLVHQDAFVRHFHRKLNPDTPGIEEMKDPCSIVAQFVLNNLALEDPDALKDAKNDPNMIAL
ncbi:hypothetical protein BGZ47_002911 [Haplosporangium gracile]|nr:hypothetical protein BGZ47_002911 [Haplosporangium gracile]